MSKDRETKRSRVDVSMFGESIGLADVRILVEGTSIPVIKTVLSIVSPVFRIMFTGDFKEKDQNEIPLPGKKVDDVLKLLKCIYPDIMMTITESVAFSILPLSREYQMISLEKRCEDALLQSLDKKFDDFYLKDCAYVCKFLSVSVEFSLKSLKEYCISLLADFKQEQRKPSMQGHNIPDNVVIQIDDLAITRLEVRHDDVTAMVSDERRYYPVEDIITSYLNLSNESERGKTIDDHMRALRLAYSFGNSYQYIRERAVLQILEDKGNKDWCHDKDFKLLTENIKYDIEHSTPHNCE